MRTISAFGPDGKQDIHTDVRGDLAVATDGEDVRQRVVEAIQLTLGEWFLDTGRGVPYYSSIFTQPAREGLAAAAIESVVRGVAGVAGVSDVRVELDRAARSLRWSASLSTDFGAIEIAGGSV